MGIFSPFTLSIKSCKSCYPENLVLLMIMLIKFLEWWIPNCDSKINKIGGWLLKLDWPISAATFWWKNANLTGKIFIGNHQPKTR